MDNIGYILPEIRHVKIRNSCDLYGASYVAAYYCGFKASLKPVNGHWQHGHVPCFGAVHPVAVMVDWVSRDSDECYFVARKDQEIYLKNNRFKNVYAIGLPIVYLPQENIERNPGSLLVLPAHSLDSSTHDWDFAAYAEEIERIRKYFSEVVICIHPSCVKKGYWIDEFKHRGFKIIIGASLFDRNALKRMQTLFCSFEYVTTNVFGSHIVYAAYFGAKVSMFGKYAAYKTDDFNNERFYKGHQHLIEPVVHYYSEQVMRQHYPELFCNPLESKENVEWARQQAGYDNKISPALMRRLFGWRVADVLVYYMFEIPLWVFRKLRGITPGFIKKFLKNLFR